MPKKDSTKSIKKKENEISGLVFVGFLMIGIGFGFLLGNIVVGSLFGLGAGFIAKAIVDSINKKHF